jgi:hypothetical protein
MSDTDLTIKNATSFDVRPTLKTIYLHLLIMIYMKGYINSSIPDLTNYLTADLVYNLPTNQLMFLE